MTMQEIDRRRAWLERCRVEARKLQGTSRQDAEYREAAAERNVEDALREWWEQGCKEPPAERGYHDHERDSGALLALLAEIDRLTEKFDGKKDPPGWGLSPAQLMLIVENLKSGAETIRRHLPPPIDCASFNMQKRR